MKQILGYLECENLQPFLNTTILNTYIHSGFCEHQRKQIMKQNRQQGFLPHCQGISDTHNVHGSAQVYHNFTANALELRQYCAKP